MLLHEDITSIHSRFSVREDICKCGYSKIEHNDEAIKPEDFTGESWHKHRHLHEVPTDAFGDISFGGLGQKTGKVKLSYLSTLINLHVYACLFVFILAFLSAFHSQYMRVSTDTNPEILYQLLTEQWRLSPPNLLISVTGGAKNFYLKARLNNMFNRGLIKVAQTTGEPHMYSKGLPMISQNICECMCFMNMCSYGVWAYACDKICCI